MLDEDAYTLFIYIEVGRQTCFMLVLVFMCSSHHAVLKHHVVNVHGKLYA